MWKWIAGKNPIGTIQITLLKEKWCKRNGWWDKKECYMIPRFGCFFCQYNTDHNKAAFGNDHKHCCVKCPANILEKEPLRAYWCESLEIDWCSRPKEFYAELVQLDKIRRTKK
jgi:hypothetical protein